MFEITINENIYSFSFGIGFVREINKRTVQTVNGIRKEVGLQYAIAGIIDRDIIDIIDVLLAANKFAGGNRLTSKMLEVYMDDESTDIEALCEDILCFFGQSNATKTTLAKMQKLMDEMKANG